jgi:hypothetical protein
MTFVIANIFTFHFIKLNCGLQSEGDHEFLVPTYFVYLGFPATINILVFMM